MLYREYRNAYSKRVRRGGRVVRVENGETLSHRTKVRVALRGRHHWLRMAIARRTPCSDFRVHVAVAHNRTEHPPKWHLQYVIAGVVVLEVPDSHPAPEGAVGLGSQKSKDERGPPHQGANGYHEAFLRLSARYPEPIFTVTDTSRDSCLARSTAWS